jgi:hypothetical protein
MIKTIYILIVVAVMAGFVQVLISTKQEVPSDDQTIACTMEAMLCPDGSYVGRTGPKCEFVCPELPDISPELKTYIDEKADEIKLNIPAPNTVIENPLTIRGQARGNYFFEGSFPIVLTMWDGLIIAEGVAIAEGDSMTTDFVNFSAELEYTNPYKIQDPEFMKQGFVILKKDNPSGLLENNSSLEIPIFFTK